MSTDYLALLRGQFNSQVSVDERRRGVFQLILPACQDDGDMVAIFLEPIEKDGEEWVRISDDGMTVMHVFDVDLTIPEGYGLFKKVVARNRIGEDGGNLLLDVKPGNLLQEVFHFIHAITAVHGIGMLKP